MRTRPGHQGQQIRILLIEDDEDDYVITRSLCREMRYFDAALDWVTNYDDANAKVQSVKYDAVLLDYFLGSYNGIDVLKLIQNECSAPVIILTGVEEHAADVASVKAGAADYLVKSQVNAPLLERSLRYAIEHKRVETAWRGTMLENQRLASAITNLPVGVVISDPQQADNPIIFVNPAFTEITGYTMMEATGQNWRFLKAEHTNPNTFKDLEKAFFEFRHHNSELLLQRKNGAPFWCNTRWNPLIQNGKPVSWVGLLHDITAQVEAEARSQKLVLDLGERVKELMTLHKAARVLQEEDTPAQQMLEKLIELIPAGFRYPHAAARITLDSREYSSPGFVPSDECLKSSITLSDGRECSVEVTYISSTLPEGKTFLAEEKILVDSIAEMLRSRLERDLARYALQRAHDQLEVRVQERTAELTATNTALQQEMLEREAIARALSQNEERLLNINSELLALTRFKIPEQDDLKSLLPEITEAAARTLDVERVSVWLLDEDGTKITCQNFFQRSTQAHESGSVIYEKDVPKYFQALQSESIIAAHDAQNDPRTSEMSEFYLQPENVTSMLDASIFQEGRMIGVICHEHVGPPRQWTLEEQNFAGSLAHLITVVMAELERRRAHQELQMALSAAEMGVWRMDAATGHEYWSDNISLLYGRDPATFEASSEVFLDLVHPDDRQTILDVSGKAIKAKQEFSVSFRVVWPDGSVHWLESRARPMYDNAGNTLQLVGVTLDVSKRQAADEALHRAMSEAEEARKTAEEANRAKSEFLSRMSHELRTPLNSILGFGQLLQRSQLEEKQMARTDLIVTAGKHLLGLINEILDLSRVESGRIALSIEPVHVGEALVEAISLTAPLAQKRGITLQNETEEIVDYVLADRQRLKQILLNLLSNAVKYNRDDGLIRVWSERCESKLQIKICNTGMAIPQEDIERVFLAFERLHADNYGIEGTGLGLALALRLAEAMGGTIEAESSDDQSTPRADDETSPDSQSQNTFTVTLPLSSFEPDSLLAVIESPALPTVPPSSTILYIEDNLANLKLVESIFSELGNIKLLTAMQGGIGLELARDHVPDLILLDLHLPDIDGSEVLRRLQKNGTTKPIPVVMLSADATSGRREQLHMMGARHYLTKPIDVQQFINYVSEVLSNSTPA